MASLCTACETKRSRDRFRDHATFSDGALVRRLERLVVVPPAGDRTADGAHRPHHGTYDKQDDSEHCQQMNTEHKSKDEQDGSDDNHGDFLYLAGI
jgi:hypothetical protein